MENTNLNIAVAVVAAVDKRFLAVRKRGTRFFIQPGGKIEQYESARKALCRELHEELGWDISEGDLVAIGTRKALAANEPGINMDVHLFAMTAPHEPLPGREIEEYQWLTNSDKLRADISPLTLELITEYCQQ